MKTKPILLTITVLIALSVVAGMVLHQHDGPRIIGELEPGDASDISKAALDVERHWTKYTMKMDLRRRKFGDLARLVCNYPFVKVVSIEAIDSEDVVVRLGAGSNKIQAQYALEREGASWDATAMSHPLSPFSLKMHSTNSAQGGGL